MKRIATILAFLLAAAAAFAQNAIKVNVQNLVAVDEQFSVTFIIEGEGRPSGFEWECGDNFQLVWGPQKGSSSSISIVNGKRVWTVEYSIKNAGAPKFDYKRCIYFVAEATSTYRCDIESASGNNSWIDMIVYPKDA